MRAETDSFGKIDVPADRLWGACTQRSIQFFHVGKQRMPQELIRALALVKKCAALVNSERGRLPAEKCSAIVKASQQIIRGEHQDQFPLVVWQTGSGTQSNMNVNEVIANRASQLLGHERGSKFVQPNDEVNLGQSSNDCFPTAMHIVCVDLGLRLLLPSLSRFHSAIVDKAEQLSNVVKVGRTHLQDATPVTLGQEFSGYATQIARNRTRLESALDEVLQLAQGATAVGTGLHAPPDFDIDFCKILSKETGYNFRPAKNKFYALATEDSLCALSGVLNTLATSLTKICNDIRLMGTGPRCGIGELLLPANEPGSSIMPGKVNPTQCEALSMVCCQVMGNHLATTLGCSQGHLQLNVYRPLIIRNVSASMKLLAESMDQFRQHCLAGIKSSAKCEQLMRESLMNVTVLTSSIGYQRAAAIAKLADKEGLTLREAAKRLGMAEEEFDRLMDFDKLLGPNKTLTFQ